MFKKEDVAALLVSMHDLSRTFRQKQRYIEALLKADPKGRTTILDVETRWNSTFYMVQRLVELKAAVNAALGEMQDYSKNLKN